ncbi:MAG: hypothetical protein WD648_08120 [Planctomycetaceae bacterium]
MAFSMAIPGTPQSGSSRESWDRFIVPGVVFLSCLFVYLANGDPIVIFFLALFSVPFCGFVSRIVSVRVFYIGFLIGIGIEWGCHWYVVTRTIEPNLPAQNPAQTFLFPFTFFFDTVWPSDPLSADFSSRTALQNSLKAHVAGSAVAGLVGGFMSLIGWYWLGVQRAFEKLAAPIHSAWTRQSSERKRRVRLALWLTSDLVFAGIVAGWWWRSFGALASLLFAAAIFLLIAVIVWLQGKQPEAQSPSQ